MRRIRRRFKLKPLLIRLKQTLGEMPHTATIRMPDHMAKALIRRKLATVVADTKIMADIEIEDEHLPYIGIFQDPAWLAAGAAPVEYR